MLCSDIRASLVHKLYVCIHSCFCLYVPVCMPTYTYKGVYMQTCMLARAHVRTWCAQRMYICSRVLAHAHVYAHTHLPLCQRCVCAWMHACVYASAYIHMNMGSTLSNDCAHVSTHVLIRAQVCVRFHPSIVYLSMSRVYTHYCVCIYTCIHTYLCVHVSVLTHAHTCVLYVLMHAHSTRMCR